MSERRVAYSLLHTIDMQDCVVTKFTNPKTSAAVIQFYRCTLVIPGLFSLFLERKLICVWRSLDINCTFGS
jgi:hypothetical protein